MFDMTKKIRVSVAYIHDKKKTEKQKLEKRVKNRGFFSYLIFCPTFSFSISNNIFYELKEKKITQIFSI